MEWISSEQLPEYEQRVLGYTYCTCVYGPDSMTHKMGCCRDKYQICIYVEKCHRSKKNYDEFPDRKPSFWVYEDYWSPYKPDFWMKLPNQPERSKRENSQNV